MRVLLKRIQRRVHHAGNRRLQENRFSMETNGVFRQRPLSKSTLEFSQRKQTVRRWNRTNGSEDRVPTFVKLASMTSDEEGSDH